MLRRFRRRAIAVVAVASLIASGCQTTSLNFKKTLTRDGPGVRLLLMPIDVELSELSAGGVAEPNAGWTATAEKFIDEILRDEMQKRNASFAVYEKTERDFDVNSDLVQIQKLHGVVGKTIMVHTLIPGFELPSKKGKFDWTLGAKVRELRDRFNSDYALFIYLRDSYTSGGRAVAIFIAAALFGVALQGGVQVGFATLVDLRTGEIAWFNRLARGTGDLRERKPAEETVSVLLQDFPK